MKLSFTSPNVADAAVLTPTEETIRIPSAPPAASRATLSPGLNWLRWLPYLVLLATAYAVFCVTPDDPYITYRYAANLLGGHGLVYNIGERVEGFSSPLHLLLSVLLLKLAPGVDILFKAKLLGLAFALLAVFWTGRLARLCGLSEPLILVAQGLVALNINYAQAALNGLETTLFSFLILVCLEAFLTEQREGRGTRSGALLFAALLARPEAGLLFAALLALRLAWRGRRPASGLWGWAAAFCLPAAGLFAARYAYYGSLVPNTYFAKQIGLAHGLGSGLLYLTHPASLVPVSWADWRHFHPSQAVSVLSMLAFWGLAALGAVRLRRTPFGWVLGAAVLAQVAFVLRCGGDWMPGWRFFSPLAPVLAVLQASGLALLCGSALPQARLLRLAPAAALALWAMCALVSPHAPWSRAGFSTHGDVLMAADTPLGRKWVATSRYVGLALPHGSVVAYSELGLVGFTNLDKTFIDTRGLTDREIARLPSAVKYPWGVDDPDWMTPGNLLYESLARRHPHAIIAFSHGPQMPDTVLGRYTLKATVADPRDPPSQIEPSLVYIRKEETASANAGL